jgi:uncharacterized protein YndB with AHSA1/START domain
MAVRTSAAATAPTSTARELVVTRAFDAPRPRVFEAWSGPERLVRWWGPRGFTTPAGKMDVRPDGAWRVCMRSPEGSLRWLQCAYREIVEPERLAFTWAWEDRAGEPGHETLVTVNFAEQAGKTRLIVHQAAFEPATPDAPEDDRDDWEARLDRLDMLLRDLPASAEPTLPARPGSPPPAPSSAAAPELVVTRLLDAPRSLVFKVWTQPEHLARWWGPKDFTLLSCETDVRPGGTWVRCMRAPAGTKHIKRGIYREIVEPERLVFTYVDEDAEGRLGPETLVSVTFEEQGGKTKLTLRQSGFESIGSRDAHEGGWVSCLERFAEYLANV